MHDDSHPPHDEALDVFLDTLRSRTDALADASVEGLDATARTRHVASQAVMATPLWPLLLATLTLSTAALVAYLDLICLEAHLLTFTL